VKRVLLGLLLAAGVAARAAAPFFPFCIDWHDAKKRGFAEQATMLKELGYDGVGHIFLPKLAERIASLDAAGLKLYQITMQVNLAPTAKAPYDEQQFKEALALVKGRHVQFLLLMHGQKPSDTAVDARAVALVRGMADRARDAGSQVLLYPHVGDWIERLEDACRVADQVDRPNVGVMFNLCHWLRVSKDRDYQPLLTQAMPRLRAVSINGADEFDSQPGWAHYIQPLGRGSFDMFTFLKTLRQLGYTGPIGLQCYGITGDVRDPLAESISAWHSYAGGTSSK